jgi:phosphoglucosamine mutase
MAALVREHGANAGLAFDGDADRIIFADEKGEILDGDQLMAICASYYLKQKSLKQNTVVATVMSNLGLELAVRNLGGSLIRTPVGDRYVVERMRQNGCNLGGEQSGHLIFLDCGTTGDGILSALQVLAVMLKEGKPLSELKAIMERFPQKLVNIPVNGRRSMSEFPELIKLEESLQKRLGDKGRLMIRPSGTEPVLRVMVEGADQKLIDEVAEEMITAIKKFMV